VLSLASLLAAGFMLQHAPTPAPIEAIPPAIGPGPMLHAGFPRYDFGLAVGDTGGSQRPKAIEYSQLYYTRLAIHRYASFATLPLFVAEFAVGQALYNQTAPPGTAPVSQSLRSWHSLLAGGVAALFAVNTITGTWNLWEGRKAKEGRTRRYVHSALMFLSDAGFVATGAITPGRRDIRGLGDPNRRAFHRTLATASMGTALVSYLMMLIGNR
jgi:hypothetical protein